MEPENKSGVLRAPRLFSVTFRELLKSKLNNS
jgi:hypothetical protein